MNIYQTWTFNDFYVDGYPPCMIFNPYHDTPLWPNSNPYHDTPIRPNSSVEIHSQKEMKPNGFSSELSDNLPAQFWWTDSQNVKMQIQSFLRTAILINKQNVTAKLILFSSWLDQMCRKQACYRASLNIYTMDFCLLLRPIKTGFLHLQACHMSINDRYLLLTVYFL